MAGYIRVHNDHRPRPRLRRCIVPRRGVKRRRGLYLMLMSSTRASNSL